MDKYWQRIYPGNLHPYQALDFFQKAPEGFLRAFSRHPSTPPEESVLCYLSSSIRFASSRTSETWIHRVFALLCLVSYITFLRFSLIDDVTVASFYCCVLFHCVIASFSTLPLKNIQVVPVWGSFSGGSLICSFDLQSILT